MSSAAEVEAAKRRYERLMLSDSSTAQECTDAFNALVEAQRAEAERQRNALSRERIKSMTLDEYESREAEIDRWLKAGARDGEPAPAGPERPADHEFSLDEIRSMSVDEFASNEANIVAQAGRLGEARAAERQAQRATAGRG